MCYEIQRKVSDAYLPAFKDILEKNSMNFLSMKVSDEHKDMKEATDMIIKIEGGDVALRVRDASIKYRDLTIRSRTKFGGKTELQKLKEGFGDWYLYGWGRQRIIEEYVLVDLDRMRDFKILDKNRKEIPNGDGTYFVNIDLGELEMCGCIISKKLNTSTQNSIDKFIRNNLNLSL